MLETGTIIATAIGYIVNGIKSSKGFQNASDDISEGFWEWIKPIFIKDDKELISEMETNPDDYDLQIELKNKLKRITKNNPDFTKKLSDFIIKNDKSNTHTPKIIQKHYGNGDIISGDKVINIKR